MARTAFVQQLQQINRRRGEDGDECVAIVNTAPSVLEVGVDTGVAGGGERRRRYRLALRVQGVAVFEAETEYGDATRHRDVELTAAVDFFTWLDGLRVEVRNAFDDASATFAMARALRDPPTPGESVPRDGTIAAARKNIEGLIAPGLNIMADAAIDDLVEAVLAGARRSGYLRVEPVTADRECSCKRTDDGKGIYASGACPVHGQSHGGGMAGHDDD